MPSLNLDLNYFDHVKTIRLVARLGPGSDVLPIRLWAWVGSHQPETGRLALLEAELEHICRWWGEKGVMVTAMIEIGFIKKDGDICEINDWLEHSGHLAAFKKRAQKAARIRWGIKRKSSNATSIAKGKPKQSPSRAVHSRALPTKHLTSELVFSFEEIYNEYPNKDSRKEAERHFRASVKTTDDFDDIKKALENYIQHLTAEPWKQAKSAKTWFNNWRDWIDFDGAGVQRPVPQKYVENIPAEEDIFDPNEKETV